MGFFTDALLQFIRVYSV